MTVLSNLAVRDLETLVHPYTNLAAIRDMGPLIIERAKGIHVYDTEGKEYIEGMAGLWCTSLGYGNEELVEAAAAQMRKLSFAHLFGGRSHDPAIELAEKLKEIAPVPISKVFFCNSGSEANDSQMKLVWYMNNGLGRPKKKKIVSRQRAYHGVTIAAASLTALSANHTDFDLPIAGVVYTGCPHHYRYAKDGESEEEFSTRLAHELEELILREDPDTVAAFIAEPVMGAGGVIVPPAGYFEKIMKVCTKYDLLMIADEVICGFGRLGRMFGSEVVGFKPDTVSVAKALSSAYLPIAAVLVPERMYQAMVAESAQDRRLRPRFHLFGPSGRGRGRAQDARNLCARRDRRKGGNDGAAVPAMAAAPRRAPAGRRGPGHRAGRRGRAGCGQAHQAVVRTEAARRGTLRRLCPGGGPDPAHARRRHLVAVPAAGHIAATDRRIVRAADAGARPHPGLGEGPGAARGFSAA